jgi:hypothetical protein
MKKEALHTAAREAELPAISHITWQAENPDVLLGRTRQTSACHYSSPSGLPTNCGAPFSTLPESLTSFIFHLRAHLPAFSIAIFSLLTIRHCVSQKKFFQSHFRLSFSLHTVHALCFSIFFF